MQWQKSMWSKVTYWREKKRLYREWHSAANGVPASLKADKVTPGKRKYKPPDLVKASFLKEQLDNWVSDPDAYDSASDAGSDPENSDDDENDGTENIAVHNGTAAVIQPGGVEQSGPDSVLRPGDGVDDGDTGVSARRGVQPSGPARLSP